MMQQQLYHRYLSNLSKNLDSSSNSHNLEADLQAGQGRGRGWRHNWLPKRLPNIVKIYLTPNHLLFDRQLLCYSNTTSTVVTNLTVLWSNTDKKNCISNHFWHWWRHEYLVNLCETQRASRLNITSKKLCCVSLWWKCAQTLLEKCHTSMGIT